MTDVSQDRLRSALERVERALHLYGEAQDARDHRAHAAADTMHEKADEEILAAFKDIPDLTDLLPELADEIKRSGRPFPGSPFQYLEQVQSLLKRIVK